jgi:hypothetical protein
MAHNLAETRGRGADYEPYFPSEWALTSLLPLTSNYPTTQPLTCSPWQERKHILTYSNVVTTAMGNKEG